MTFDKSQTCKNCEHWKPNMTGKAGECFRITQYSKGPVVQVNVGEGHLVTTPDFGCVLYEKKE